MMAVADEQMFIRRRCLAILLVAGPFIMWRVDQQSLHRSMEAQIGRDFKAPSISSQLRPPTPDFLEKTEETSTANSGNIANIERMLRKSGSPGILRSGGHLPQSANNDASTRWMDEEGPQRNDAIESSIPNGCNCLNETNIWCCQRTAIVVFGLGSPLRHPVIPIDQMGDNINVQHIKADHPLEREFQFEFKKPASDYRHVVITRNWYDVIVDGYLYHKAGFECWLDPNTNEVTPGWLFDNSKEDWEQRIVSNSDSSAAHHPWPAGNGRSLCQYLSEEAQEIGLRVYSEWAVCVFMMPLLEFTRTRRLAEERDALTRTLLACMDQENDSLTSSLHSFLYPQAPKTTSHTNSTWSTKSVTDLAEHRSHQKQLHDFVEKLDMKIFGSRIAHGNSQLGCTESYQMAVSM